MNRFGTFGNKKIISEETFVVYHRKMLEEYSGFKTFGAQPGLIRGLTYLLLRRILCLICLIHWKTRLPILTLH